MFTLLETWKRTISIYGNSSNFMYDLFSGPVGLLYNPDQENEGCEQGIEIIIASPPYQPNNQVLKKEENR